MPERILKQTAKGILTMTQENVQNWSVETWTVYKFKLESAFIDMNPIGQRLETNSNAIGESKPSKQQSIIDSMLRGSDIGEIKIVRTPDATYPNESVDGGHRKRAILSFIDNKFPTHKTSPVGEKFWREFTDAERKAFLQFGIRFVIFDFLTNRQKGELFRDTNNTTPVNQQETLNSYGDMPIANLVRNTARSVDDNLPHQLFEWAISNAGNVNYRNIAFDNNRLVIDEIVARIAFIIYSGDKVNTTTYDQLTAMYDDQNLGEKEVAKIGKKLKEVLDFILKVSIARKKVHGRGLTKGMMVMLYRLYFHFKEEYGSFKVEDYSEFFDEFYKAFSAFDLRSPTRTEIVEKSRDGSGGRLIYEAFNQHLGEHKTLYKTRNTITWMLEEMNLNAATLITQDSKRCFSREEIEVTLARQGYKCWVDGMPLVMKDAEGGHIVPHSKGGKTEIGNLVVIRGVHNRRMQDVNANNFKENFLRVIDQAITRTEETV
jgi:hypothetical protein